MIGDVGRSGGWGTTAFSLVVSAMTDLDVWRPPSGGPAA